jgi:hypothetical protein
MPGNPSLSAPIRELPERRPDLAKALMRRTNKSRVTVSDRIIMVSR